MVTRLIYKCKSDQKLMCGVGPHGIATTMITLQTVLMMILGQTSSGLKQLIDLKGQRINSKVAPSRCYWGVASDEFIAKRLWVDSVLDDAERLLYLRSQLTPGVPVSIDYEILQHDAGRMLLHAYALRQPLKHRVAAIETHFHGLGRALRRLYKTTQVMQCLSIYEDAVELSVHLRDCVFYFRRESYTGWRQMIFALRRAQHCYFASNPVAYQHCYYLNFSGNSKLNSIADIESNVPIVVINPTWLTWLVPYGLACRGLKND